MYRKIRSSNELIADFELIDCHQTSFSSLNPFTMLTHRPNVTIILTQRERFSLTQPSLESILADYDAYPFQLIYVDGNSPSHIASYLQATAECYPFMTLIRQEQYLRSNVARNQALPLATDADYIAFLDNDDIVEPGWLEKLVACAEEEKAGIVTPSNPSRTARTAGY